MLSGPKGHKPPSAVSWQKFPLSTDMWVLISPGFHLAFNTIGKFHWKGQRSHHPEGFQEMSGQVGEL